MWNTWKFIREDKAELYGMMFSVMPLAQTPWDRKHARSQKKHSTHIQKIIDNIAPWQNKGTRRSKLSHLRGKIETGKTVVMLDKGDTANLGLYDDAEIIQE